MTKLSLKRNNFRGKVKRSKKVKSKRYKGGALGTRSRVKKAAETLNKRQKMGAI